MQAGDDLRKKLIEEHLVSNLIAHCEENGKQNAENALRMLLGSEQGQYDHQRVVLLRNFMQQIAIPVTDAYLHRMNNSGQDHLGYSDIFAQQPVKEDLRNQILALTHIDIKEVVWQIDPLDLNNTARAFFSAQLKAISGILGTLDCDIVLLAGGTFKIESLESEFHRGLGILKSRIVNLNHWRPGNWHPFTDEHGNLKDTKSCVTLGAAIALHAGYTKTLPGFSLNTDFLKTDITSTARCVWRDGHGSDRLLMSAEADTVSFGVSTLPVKLEVSSIHSPNYHTKPAYRIHINKTKIKMNLKSRGLTDVQCEDEMNDRIQELHKRGPFQISLSRDRGEGFESIVIDEVSDNQENSISPSNFEMIRQSLPEEEYWIERGINITMNNHV